MIFLKMIFIDFYSLGGSENKEHILKLAHFLGLNFAGRQYFPQDLVEGLEKMSKFAVILEPSAPVKILAEEKVDLPPPPINPEAVETPARENKNSVSELPPPPYAAIMSESLPPSYDQVVAESEAKQNPANTVVTPSAPTAVNLNLEQPTPASSSSSFVARQLANSAPQQQLQPSAPPLPAPVSALAAATSLDATPRRDFSLVQRKYQMPQSKSEEQQVNNNVLRL